MGAAPSTPVVGITTVDQRELEEGSIWRLLDSCDPDLVQLVVVCRNVADAWRDQLGAHRATLAVVSLGSAGLSRARNAGIDYLSVHDPDGGLVVCFPDDDCTFAPGSVEFACGLLDGLDLVLGTYGEPGFVGAGTAGQLSLRSVFHYGNSVGIFTRWRVVQRVGGFDEWLGVGSGDVEAAEDIEFLMRVVKFGFAARYEPSLVVNHPRRSEPVPARSGAYLVVAVRALPDAQAIVRIVRAVGGSMIGMSPIPRRRLIHLLRPRKRQGIT